MNKEIRVLSEWDAKEGDVFCYEGGGISGCVEGEPDFTTWKED